MIIRSSDNHFTIYVLDSKGRVHKKEFWDEANARFAWAKEQHDSLGVQASPWDVEIINRQDAHLIHVIDATNLNKSTTKHIADKGVLIGGNEKVEWLLDWWWKHYSRHNDLPVAFVDLGLSKEKRQWCMENGALIDLSGSCLAPVDNKTFKCNCGWKPFSIFFAPFKTTAWIDLDCEVRGNVEGMFEFGQKFAIAKDNLYHNARRVRKNKEVREAMQGEIMYNAGVLVVHQDSQLLQLWMNAIKAGPQEWRKSDQPLLQTLLTKKPDLFELLPQKYNYLCPYKWFAKEFGNLPDEAVILHRLSSHKYSTEVIKAEIDDSDFEPTNHAERLKYLRLYGEQDKAYREEYDPKGYGGVNHGQKAQDILKELNAKSICDVGTGQGNFCVWAANEGMEVYGVDVASVAAGKVIEHPGVTYIDAEAKRIPLSDKSVDYVVSFDCLEHCLSKDVKHHIFKEFNRIARKGFVLKIVETRWNVWNIQLHMTAKPIDWWIEQIKPFASVEQRDGYLICILSQENV